MGLNNPTDRNYGLFKERCALILLKSLESKIYLKGFSKGIGYRRCFSGPSDILKYGRNQPSRIFVSRDSESRWPIPENFLPNSNWLQLVRGDTYSIVNYERFQYT